MTFIGGTIPSGLCSTTGFNINVTNTNIHCYSGCLTSAKVIIEGATHICPDGSIMERFGTVVGVCVAVSLLATVWYKYHRCKYNRKSVSVSLFTAEKDKFEVIHEASDSFLGITFTKYVCLVIYFLE